VALLLSEISEKINVNNPKIKVQMEERKGIEIRKRLKVVI